MIKSHSCPVCDQVMPGTPAADQAYFPFCSTRCRQIDLYRWSLGKYAIVEEIDPTVAEFLKDDPNILLQGEGINEYPED